MSPVPALLARLATEVPVDPDAATAREWARDELADPVYHQRPSLLQLLLGWLEEQLGEANRALSMVDARTAALLVVGAVVVAGVVALAVAGPVARARRPRRPS
ncbi:MAG TPA: hypothetical protein VN257_08205, partial [Actinotalea sp.]|nr:hypothetical protein [Actinotalea sp.]